MTRQDVYNVFTENDKVELKQAESLINKLFEKMMDFTYEYVYETGESTAQERDIITDKLLEALQDIEAIERMLKMRD